MAKYQAVVSWKSDGEFMSGRYSRGHELSFDGGAVVRGSSSPLVVPQFSDPAGVDPEEALIASASACHMLWFLSLAQAAGLDIASYRDEASGTLGKDASGRIAMTEIILAPKIEFAGGEPDPAVVDRLHHEAHEKCVIANSLLTRIRIAGRG